MVTGLIARSLVNAPIRRLGIASAVSWVFSSTVDFVRDMVGPRVVAINNLETVEHDLIQALGGALMDRDRAITVVLTRGQRRPRRWGRHLVLAREHPDTQRAVRAVSRDPRTVYPVALALKMPHWSLRPGIRSAWLDFDNLV